jgi:hypothetical protein
MAAFTWFSVTARQTQMNIFRKHNEFGYQVQEDLGSMMVSR